MALVVIGKIESARKSKSGKSVAVNVGGTWINVNASDMDAFKTAVGSGKGIPVRARTDLVVTDEGTPKMREFRKKDGTMGSSPDIHVRYWFNTGTTVDSDLSDLIGIDIEA
jgi:hypothetical protein